MEREFSRKVASTKDSERMLQVHLSIILLFLAVICTAVYCLGPAIGRLNRTPSLPVGFYVAKGGTDIISFCLSKPWAEVALERGYRQKADGDTCPDGGQPLMKRIVARAGDTIQENRRGVWINGRLQQNSAPLPLDGKERPLEPFIDGAYTLSGNQLWVMGDIPKSFDSRYYGPIRQSDVRGHWEARFVWR